MFIGGIGSLEKEQIAAYFGKYGTIEETIVPTDRNDNNKKRGFAFVIFESHETVNRVVGKNGTDAMVVGKNGTDEIYLYVCDVCPILILTTCVKMSFLISC